MSLWSSVDTNGMYDMKSFYDRKGMYEIRVKYATWIEDKLEEKNTDRIDEAAIQFCNDLEYYIRNSSDTSIDSETKNFLMCSRMRQISALEFFTHLLEGMAMEVLLTSHEARPSNEMHQLEYIKRLIISCDEFYQLPNICLEPEMNEISRAINYLVDIFQACEKFKRSVFEELKNWQRQQIRNSIEDVPQKDNLIQIQNTVQADKLNQIQNCIEKLVEVNFRLIQLTESIRMRRRQMPDDKYEYEYEKLEQLTQQIQITQKNLMIESFIVDNQPNQVIKTNTNFSASVRWLIGPQLGSNNRISNVKCIVVSELQARSLSKEPQINHDIESSSKEILRNEIKLEYQEENRVYSANFKNLQIKKIQRSERRGSSESVMDEKLALLFQMTVNLGNSSFTISTLSLPVVVIVHGNQEHQACATILWDTSFAEVGRELFVVPDRVTWTKLSEALYCKCFSETKRGFTDANRYFLYEKFFPNCSMIPEAEITWGRFCKDELTGYYFTFWDWFYHTIKLIKERLLEPWNDGLIEGFISKSAATEKLQSQPPGTFLLRFSDSIKGAITVSFVTQFNTVDHVQPWTVRELQNRCLADRIRDLEELKNLFPYGIHKYLLFNKFCSPDDKKVSGGYVPGIPITTIIRTRPVIENERATINLDQENTMVFEDMLKEDENSMDFNFDLSYIEYNNKPYLDKIIQNF